MSQRILPILLIAVAALATPVVATGAGEPGIWHSVFMAGSVIESSSEGVYLCIGTPDGAKVGQALEVVRMIRDPGVNPKQGARFHPERVGSVRIDSIVDEHFAKATVTSGKARKGDIVRLKDSTEGAKKE
ncbi:MAG: hypothetical protein ABJC13_19940 [Acidobacteriota bacterium]